MLGNVTRHSLDMNWLTFSLSMKSFTVKNLSDYENGKRFMYEHVTHLNTISENKGIRHDHQWENQCSMEVNKGTSFLRANVGGARDSEKTFRAGYLNEV